MWLYKYNIWDYGMYLYRTPWYGTVVCRTAWYLHMSCDIVQTHVVVFTKTAVALIVEYYSYGL